MKRARKFVSAVLAVLMVTSAFSMLTFSASAAETTEKNEITVTSNVADPVTYSYSADSEQFTVTYKFQSDLKLINNQAYVTYDSTKLKLADTNKQKTCVPVFSEGGSTVSNFEKADKILFNSSSLDLYDFTTESTYFTATFDIIGTGATTLDLTLQVMTATQATSYDDVFDYPEVKLARYDVINKDLFKMTCMGQVTPEVVPTTQPTTAAPTTQPTTVAPTTVAPTTVAPTTPVEGVSVFGDINLDLTANGTVYTGTTKLSAGTYTFKMNVNGTTYCCGSTFADQTVDALYKSVYKSASTLKATGGTYTFKYDTATNKLTIEFVSASAVSVFGDINLDLKANGAVCTGTTDLEAGTYTFRMNVGGDTYCCGSTFTDETRDALYKTVYKSATTLKASGGTYTFSYNTDTNKLTITYKAPSLASVFGDINLDLDATKVANVYTGSVELEAGQYSFRMMNQGVQFCCGYTFNDVTKNSQYRSVYKSASILNAKGGTYIFSYDIETNKLTIANVPLGALVSVSGDITLALAATDNADVYSGSVNLNAGSYQFKMNYAGKTFCKGITIKDNADNLLYKSVFTSYSTLAATGGRYTFTYNVATNCLTIKKG